MTTPAAPRAFVIGAGAQGRVVLDTWREQHPERSFAFLDDTAALWGTHVLGVRVQAGVEHLGAEPGEAILALGNNVVRRNLAERWNAVATWGQVVHPSASVSESASIGPGATILRGAIVNTEARLGQHVIVNSGAIVEHDCVIEDFSSISPGVRMGGRVVIGAGAFLSAGVTVAPRVKIGAGSVVGAGAVVVSDLPEGVLAFGVPARVVRELGPDFNWGRLL